MRRLLMTLGWACLVLAPTLAAAKDATPVTTQATPAAGEPVSLLFVQTASGSTLTPLESPDGEATHALVLQERSDQTIYFADRPNRQVGTMPTTDVLDMFAAEPDNPPNAALVALNEAGEEEIIVLELLSGTEDATTGELTYQVKLLADYTELEIGLVSEPVTEVTEARSYGDTSLFIDDYIDPRIDSRYPTRIVDTSRDGRYRECGLWVLLASTTPRDSDFNFDPETGALMPPTSGPAYEWVCRHWLYPVTGP